MSVKSFQQFLKEPIMVYIFAAFCGSNMAQSKVKTGDAILHFFMKNQLQTDAFVAFVKSLSSVSSISIATLQRSLQQGVCSRGSLNGSF